MGEIKLYTWRPDGHGEYSFFVVAESEEKALEAVQKYIKDYLNKNDGQNCEIGGWGTDYYKLEVYHVGEVVTHDNA